MCRVTFRSKRVPWRMTFEATKFCSARIQSRIVGDYRTSNLIKTSCHQLEPIAADISGHICVNFKARLSAQEHENFLSSQFSAPKSISGKFEMSLRIEKQEQQQICATIENYMKVIKHDS